MTHFVIYATGICKDASSYITHLEWNVDGRLLMINSGAKEILYYECPRGNRVNIRDEQLQDIEWSTFTSVLGPSCEGIWQPCTDVTDINSTCLSSDRGTLATGDDFGLVKLFKYPCPTRFANSINYYSMNQIDMCRLLLKSGGSQCQSPISCATINTRLNQKKNIFVFFLIFRRILAAPCV